MTSNKDGFRLTIRSTNIENIKNVFPKLVKHLADSFLPSGYEFRSFNLLEETEATKNIPGLITSGDIVLYQTPNSKNQFILESRLFVNVSSCLSKVVEMPTRRVNEEKEEVNADDAQASVATSVSFVPPGGLALITNNSSSAAHAGSQNTLFHQNSSVTSTTSTAYQSTTMVSQNQRR